MLLALLALGCPAKIQPELAPLPSHANDPLLWQADAPGEAGGTLYLMGSVHMGTPAMQDTGC